MMPQRQNTGCNVFEPSQIPPHNRVTLKMALYRNNRRTKRAEAEREGARMVLAERVGQLTQGFSMEKARFAREVEVAETRQGAGG